MIAEELILARLKAVADPLDGKDIVSKGMVSGIHVQSDGHVQFVLEVDPARGAELEPLRQSAENALRDVAGVMNVTGILTAAKRAPDISPKAHPTNDPHGMSKNPRLDNLPIKKIIAVASGKGGVGKSTIAVSLAAGLAQQGFKTGLLDADIYGPSVPMMAGLLEEKPQTRNNKLVPLEVQGLKIMSIGLLTDGAQALVWRGPMVQTALYQMLRDVEWGTEAEPLDVLILDMPPGTGDAQLTLAQKVPASGAIIVSTPQDIALIDARKAVEMFRKTGVEVLGLIENMSVHICEKCGHESHIFGHGGAEKEANKLGIPFLEAIPLRADIREKADQGTPVPEILVSAIESLKKLI